MPSLNCVLVRSIVRGPWLILGCASFCLGTAGIFLPVLPTVPFYMLTVFCLSKGSPRLHRQFMQSSLYQKHAARFIEKRAIPLKSKLTIMSAVTVTMGFAVWAMRGIVWAQVLVAAVWVVHIVYFLCFIKTES